MDALLRPERLDILIFKRYAEHLRIEKQQCIKRLILRSCTDVPVYGKVCQKRFDWSDPTFIDTRQAANNFLRQTVDYCRPVTHLNSADPAC